MKSRFWYKTKSCYNFFSKCRVIGGNQVLLVFQDVEEDEKKNESEVKKNNLFVNRQSAESLETLVPGQFDYFAGLLIETAWSG